MNQKRVVFLEDRRDYYDPSDEGITFPKGRHFQSGFAAVVIVDGELDLIIFQSGPGDLSLANLSGTMSIVPGADTSFLKVKNEFQYPIAIETVSNDFVLTVGPSVDTKYRSVPIFLLPFAVGRYFVQKDHPAPILRQNLELGASLAEELLTKQKQVLATIPLERYRHLWSKWSWDLASLIDIDAKELGKRMRNHMFIKDMHNPDSVRHRVLILGEGLSLD